MYVCTGTPMHWMLRLHLRSITYINMHDHGISICGSTWVSSTQTLHSHANTYTCTLIPRFATYKTFTFTLPCSIFIQTTLPSTQTYTRSGMYVDELTVWYADLPAPASKWIATCSKLQVLCQITRACPRTVREYLKMNTKRREYTKNA